VAPFGQQQPAEASEQVSPFLQQKFPHVCPPGGHPQVPVEAFRQTLLGAQQVGPQSWALGQQTPPAHVVPDAQQLVPQTLAFGQQLPAMQVLPGAQVTPPQHVPAVTQLPPQHSWPDPQQVVPHTWASSQHAPLMQVVPAPQTAVPPQQPSGVVQVPPQRICPEGHAHVELEGSEHT